MATDDLNTYGTTAELAFIDTLAAKPQAAMLLSNYVAAAQKRIAWGSINAAQVTEYAALLLGNAQAAADNDRRLARAA